MQYKDGNLKNIVTFERFEVAYKNFLNQAEENAITKKAKGSRTPYGFAVEDNIIDGGYFTQHFGQGKASRTPYINWHVVSVYYVVDEARIVIGIEEARYSHLKDMNPIKTVAIGKKDKYVAIFYECNKSDIDYNELYEKFIALSAQVLKLGLK